MFQPGDRVEVNWGGEVFDATIRDKHQVEGYWIVDAPGNNKRHGCAFHGGIMRLLGQPTKPTRKKLVEVVENGRRFYAMRET